MSTPKTGNLRTQIAQKNPPPAPPADAGTVGDESAPECFNSGDSAMGITIEVGSDLYGFPYAHYLFAQALDGGRGVVIRFSTHQVLLTGSGLATIVTALSEQRLTALRLLERRYAPASSPVWIDRIEVRQLEEDGEGKSESKPDAETS